MSQTSLRLMTHGPCDPCRAPKPSEPVTEAAMSCKSSRARPCHPMAACRRTVLALGGPAQLGFGKSFVREIQQSAASVAAKSPPPKGIRRADLCICDSVLTNVERVDGESGPHAIGKKDEHAIPARASRGTAHLVESDGSGLGVRAQRCQHKHRPSVSRNLCGLRVVGWSR